MRGEERGEERREEKSKRRYSAGFDLSHC